jgi:RNA polymerase sigma-70 factor (ECF subfamily)
MDSSERVWRERGLLSAVLAGDERAWQTWYEASFAALDAYVVWRCAGLRDLADEIVQETWLTAVRRIHTFDPSAGSFAGWLCGIAGKVLRNHFRREARRGRLRAALNGRAASVESPAAALERRDVGERTACALTMLPEHYQAVLRAKYLDQQTVQEIATGRGETQKAVESLLTRARQVFREAYLTLEGHHD